MMRFIVAHLPLFRLERCGWSAHDAVVLADDERSALRVCALSPPAAAVGVVPGMTVAEARALLPALAVERLDELGEHSDLIALSEQLARFSPVVGALPPDAVVAEVGRSLPRGLSAEAQVARERSLVAELRGRLEQLGHRCQIVISDDPAVALALATWGEGDAVVPPQGGPAALAPLPLGALALPPAELALLTSLGLRRVGELAALSGSAVAGRLGAAGVAAHALAQGALPALGLSAQAEAGPLIAHRDLPEPATEQSALLFVLNGLLRELCMRLLATAAAAQAVVVRFGLSDGAVQELQLRLGRPSRDPGHMLRLLRARMERFQLLAPAERLSVELPEPQPFAGRQADLLDPHRGGEATADVVAALLDAMGPGSVGMPRLRDRHRPEQAWALEAAQPMEPRPFSGPAEPGPRSRLPLRPAALREAERRDPAATWAGHAEAQAPNRPGLLLPTPVAIEVRTGRWGRPEALHIEGRWQPLRAAQGPERIAGEWWTEDRFERSYWRCTIYDGRAAWVYQEDGRWALHGWFEAEAAQG